MSINVTIVCVLGYLSVWLTHCPLGDYYVHFQCTALTSYNEFKAKVDLRGEDKIEEVCNNGAKAFEYGWNTARDFSMYRTRPEEMKGTIYTQSQTYDVHSIMHYHSWVTRNVVAERLTTDFKKWVIVKWKRTYSANDPPPKVATSENSESIKPAKLPSVLDITALRELYAWRNP
jgi:hypothetical protein